MCILMRCKKNVLVCLRLCVSSVSVAGVYGYVCALIERIDACVFLYTCNLCVCLKSNCLHVSRVLVCVNLV